MMRLSKNLSSYDNIIAFPLQTLACQALVEVVMELMEVLHHPISALILTLILILTITQTMTMGQTLTP